MARQQLAGYARHAGIGADELDWMRLLVSELVTNSVRHARTAREDHIGLRVTTSSRRIRIEVSDAGEGFEMPRPVPHPHGAGGYGLFLVNRLCACWGDEHDQEAVVWCELDRRVTRLV